MTEPQLCLHSTNWVIVTYLGPLLETEVIINKTKKTYLEQKLNDYHINSWIAFYAYQIRILCVMLMFFQFPVFLILATNTFPKELHRNINDFSLPFLSVKCHGYSTRTIRHNRFYIIYESWYYQTRIFEISMTNVTCECRNLNVEWCACLNI